MPSSGANEHQHQQQQRYKYQTSISSINSSSSSSSNGGNSPPLNVLCNNPKFNNMTTDDTLAELQLDDDEEIEIEIETPPTTKISNTTSKRNGWNVKASQLSLNTNNKIRHVVESLAITPNPNKPMILLSIGDPTTFGNLNAADETMKGVLTAVESAKFNGYAHTCGHETSRRALVKYSAHQRPDQEIDVNDVIICSGCSSALEYCLLTLADRGQNVLLPRPGFGLYQTQCEGLNIESRYYNLLPEQQWRADLTQLESLIDENTAAIMINNPNNPCGSVFDEEHLLELIAICERHYLPIIADEIYEHFVFPGSKHIAVSSLSRGVPVLSCGGLTKRFLVPGWRVGWIIIHDRENRLGDTIGGLKNMCTRIMGANTIMQGALPDILAKTPQSFFDNVIHDIFSNAQVAYNLLKRVRGITPVMPQGAMYMMIGIDIEHFPKFKDDTHFVQEMVNEQSVFCLPGSCFDYPSYFRIVLTVPGTMIEEACTRIAEFCETHYQKNIRGLIDHNLIDGRVRF